jgi:hypothetical protein
VAVLLLIILLALFVVRVTGQIVVALFAPAWLPPMRDWYSGLLPYPLLLPSQLIIIGVMIAAIRQVRHGVSANRRLANGIFVFATLYAAAMLVRLVILRTNHPAWRWYEGGMIPILFHWVLAAFLFTYAAQRRA